MKLITVKAAHAQTDLVVLKSRLESEGIDCFLKNELTAQVLNYVPAFLVELQVYEKDLGRVEQIMAETGDSIQNGRSLDCPECNSKKVKLNISLLKKVKLYFAVFLALLANANVPWDKVFKNAQLKCKACGHLFY